MVNLISLNGPYNQTTNLITDMHVPKIEVNYNLIEASDTIEYLIVDEVQEMRIDLIVKNMYGDLGPRIYEAIDVILAINFILNPLNIKRGTVLAFPKNIESIDNFRYTESNFNPETVNVQEAIAVANKSTKKDNKRAAFVANGYSLPPTINQKSISPVRIENGAFSFGGVK